MDTTRDYHTKQSKTERERPIPSDITYMWNLKIQYKSTYLQNKTRLTDIENRLVVAKGEGGKGGKEWEFRISRGKLLYIGWINKKVILYSTGNHIQYSVTNHNGKEYEKEYIYICVCIYICITESLCCTEITQHCISTILKKGI